VCGACKCGCGSSAARLCYLCAGAQGWTRIGPLPTCGSPRPALLHPLFVNTVGSAPRSVQGTRTRGWRCLGRRRSGHLLVHVHDTVPACVLPCLHNKMARRACNTARAALNMHLWQIQETQSICCVPRSSVEHPSTPCSCYRHGPCALMQGPSPPRLAPACTAPSRRRT
jgi:hypothetical protein